MVDAMVPMPVEYDEQESIRTYEEMEALMRPRGRRNKYGAKKCQLDGHKFDSQAEMRHYLVLREMQRAGKITDLEVHPKFKLVPSRTNKKGKRRRGVTYTADFRYVAGHETVVEDVKGGKATQTQAFVIKSKLFEWLYPDVRFEIVEM